jgi:hypothetical protein
MRALAVNPEHGGVNPRWDWHRQRSRPKDRAGMGQLLLIPDPRPLDQRLGRKFFRQAPRRPGVYLMKDARNNVLYVGNRLK